MLRKIMIVLVAGVALAGAPAAQAGPHGGGGGGGHMGGGFGSHMGGFDGHVGSSFGGSHLGGSFAGGNLGGAFRGSHLGGQALVGAAPRGQLDREKGFRGHSGHHRRYGYWRGRDFGYDDYDCSYRYPLYNNNYYDRYRCYLPPY